MWVFPRVAAIRGGSVAALALYGGRASTRILGTTLGRTPSELSWIRQDLLSEGDIYSPQRGQVVMTVPIFASYILAHYDRARTTSDTDLLSLEAMRENGAAAIASPALRDSAYDLMSECAHCAAP